MKKFTQTLYSLVIPVVFFGSFFIYIWMITQPTLIYHSFGRFVSYPEFLTGKSFFLESIIAPGGMLKYTNGFLSQWLYYSWAGAAVITFIALLIYACMRILLKSGRNRGLEILPYLPALAVFITYNRYDHCLGIFLAIFYSIFCSILYGKIRPSNRIARIIIFTVFMSALYFLIGAACILFVVLVIIEEVISRTNPLSVIIYPLITAACIWIIGVHYFGLSEKQAFLLLLPLSEEIYLNMEKYSILAVSLTYILVPAAMAAGCLRMKYSVNGKEISPEKSKSNKHKSEKISFVKTFGFKQIIKAAFLLVLTPSAIYFSRNPVMESTIKLNYYARNEMWTELISCASGYKSLPYNGYFNHDVNRALCETGRMADELFCFEQQLPALLIQSKQDGSPIPAVFSRRAELLLELGHVAMAERHYFELLQSMNGCPFILEKLATINLVKGNNEIAKIFLNKLSRHVIFRKRAIETLKEIESDPQLKGNSYIQQLCLNAVLVDTPTQEFKGEEFFLQLLDKNPKNRLAFEYMMAFNLLTGQVNKIAENIHRLDDVGCRKLGRHYQETLAIYLGSKLKKVDLGRWRPDLQALTEAKEFDNIYRYHGGLRNKEASKKALEDKYGDTYLFYFVFEIKRDAK